MGDPSILRFVPAASSAVPIDWSKVPEASKQYIHEQWCTHWLTDEVSPLPPTIGDLAKIFDDTKFFGYMRPELCNLLLDISEFGLVPSAAATPSADEDEDEIPVEVGPRFYMRYIQRVWFLLLVPGKRDGATGWSPKLRVMAEDEDDEEYEEERATKELAMAQAFDSELERDVMSGAMDVLNVTEKLGGWTAANLKGSLKSAEIGSALLSLPLGHPAKALFCNNLWESFSNANGIFS